MYPAFESVHYIDESYTRALEQPQFKRSVLSENASFPNALSQGLYPARTSKRRDSPATLELKPL